MVKKNDISLYHGSRAIIAKPKFGLGKPFKDYGLGFYCTEHLALAKEWACTLDTDGYANHYQLDMRNLAVLNLSAPKYTVLHWLALIADNRRFQMATPLMRNGVDWLKTHFLLDISPYDVIIGYRADDSYFSFARAFLSNTITLNQLAYAMRLGKLGEQIVLKSPKAFDALKFVGYEQADNQTYYAKRMARDSQARADFRAELERENIDGLFLMDLIRGKVMPDDPRIRSNLP
jgi:hypothetical protein